MADEVYELLNFGPRSVDSPPFRTLSKSVVSISSFSKICGPGLRLGWVLVPEKVVQGFIAHGVLSSGGGVNPLVGAFMQHALDEKLMDKLLLEEVQPGLASRCTALCAALEKHFGSEIRWHRPEGGYFVWLEFEPEVNCSGRSSYIYSSLLFLTISFSSSLQQTF